MQQQNIEVLPAPDREAIRKHLTFIIEGMREYSDGRLEIAYNDENGDLKYAENFSIDNIEKIVDFAIEKNQLQRNVYTIGALLDPDTAPFGRSRDTDFYSCSAVWCDIDKVTTSAQIRASYQALPPSLVVVTGKAPHIRTHLWWKLEEPITDSEELRRILQGLQQHLGGDPMVKNVTSLMRLAGTVNWQTAKKRAAGRIVELTELKIPSNASGAVSAERLLQVYAPKEFILDTVKYQPAPDAYAPGILTALQDGREVFMHRMLAAAVINLTAQLKRWPTAQEVFDDAWPVYVQKVAARGGRTLEQDNRGQRAMQQKIGSKLRAFAYGHVQGMETLEKTIAAAQQYAAAHKPAPKTRSETVDNFDPETGEIIENKPVSPKSEIGETTVEELVSAGHLPTIPWLPVDQVERVIDVKDFVEGFLRDSENSVLYGRPNCGKTFCAIDLALHVALGRTWHRRAVEQGAGIYIALEGGHGAKNRIVAFKEHHQITQTIPLALISQAVTIATPEGFNLLLATIREIEATQGKTRFIVIDTLARAMAGMDENSTKDMSLFIAYCDALRERTGAHVMLIHHTGKDATKGARGSSALLGAVDTEIELSREDDGQIVTVSVTKQREMEKTQDMFYTLKKVTLGVDRRGKEVTSCVVAPTETDTERHAAFVPNKLRVAYDVLKNVFAMKSYIITSQDGFPGNCRVVTETDYRAALAMAGMISDKEETARQQFHRTRQGLIEAGIIRVHDHIIWQCER